MLKEKDVFAKTLLGATICDSGIKERSNDDLIKFLLLTITIINSKNLNKSLKNPVLLPGFQNSFQYISKFPDQSNLLSRASSKASK